jgi:hypothetical protein
MHSEIKVIQRPFYSWRDPGAFGLFIFTGKIICHQVAHYQAQLTLKIVVLVGGRIVPVVP